MTTWKKALEPAPPWLEAGVVPALLADADPYAGDEAWLAPAPYKDAAAHGLALTEADHDALDAQWRALYRAVLDGDAPRRALDEVAEKLGLTGELRLDRRPLRVAPEPITDDVLAEMAEDQVPDVGVIAPDRVLGPFADEALGPARRPAWRLAGAVLAFSPLIQQGVLPVARALHQRPRPPDEIIAGVRAVSAAAPMLWRREGEGIAPLLPLSDRQRPDGSVTGLPDAPAFVGRAALSERGWWLACALPLPAAPPAEVVESRLILELQRLRRFDRRLTWEDLLRERGEVLYRTACEWGWRHRREEVVACWQRCWR